MSTSAQEAAADVDGLSADCADCWCCCCCCGSGATEANSEAAWTVEAMRDGRGAIPPEADDDFARASHIWMKMREVLATAAEAEGAAQATSTHRSEPSEPSHRMSAFITEV